MARTKASADFLRSAYIRCKRVNACLRVTLKRPRVAAGAAVLLTPLADADILELIWSLMPPKAFAARCHALLRQVPLKDAIEQLGQAGQHDVRAENIIWVAGSDSSVGKIQK